MDRLQPLRRHSASSVIIGDLNLKGIAVAPGETDPPLIVDADAVLSFAAPFQLFQPVSGRHAKILKRDGPMQDQELPPRRSFDRTKPRNVTIVKEPLGACRPKRTDHCGIIAFNVKRYKLALLATCQPGKERAGSPSSFTSGIVVLRPLLIVAQFDRLLTCLDGEQVSSSGFARLACGDVAAPLDLSVRFSFFR